MVVFKTRPDILVRTSDGRNIVTQEPIELHTDTGANYQIPPGFASDGASIPQELWSTGLAPFGPYWLATVVHDGAYRNTLQRQLENGFWVPATLGRDASDTLLLDCMTALGVPILIKEAVYEGVRFGGWRAFRQDRETQRRD